MSLFKKATREKLKARIALMGPSGSGKTYTALKIAKGFGPKIAVIDTERRSARKYAGTVADFDVIELATFEPEHYIKAIRAAAAEGFDVVVIDSLSHAWAGVGGLLDQKDKAGGNSFTAWAKLTPQHNALIDAMLSCPIHLIACMRSKMEYVLETDAKGKAVPRKVGMAPVQREGMEYEFDVIAEMDLEHTMHVTKSRCEDLDGKQIRKPDEQVAADLLVWLNTGKVSSTSAPATKSTGNGTAPYLPEDPDAAIVFVTDRLEALNHAKAIDNWLTKHYEKDIKPRGDVFIATVKELVTARRATLAEALGPPLEMDVEIDKAMGGPITDPA